MNFVMTGHKGLIGSFLLKKLEGFNYNPSLLIDKREGRDILDIDNYKLNEKPDMMIHLASFCKINETIKHPELSFQNNVFGMHRILEFCKSRKIPKIIFTSSSRSLEKEKNPYTSSKIYGEELVKAYSECYGIDYVIIRPSTVYGPFNDLSRRLIDVWMLNVLKGEELKIFGGEEKTLDFTYIDDFVRGFVIAVKEKNKEFNISSGDETRVSDVADLIISLAGKGTKRFYPAEIAQPQKIKIDISKIKELGYEPCIRWREGIKKTFEWYKNNIDEILESRKLLR